MRCGVVILWCMFCVALHGMDASTTSSSSDKDPELALSELQQQPSVSLAQDPAARSLEYEDEPEALIEEERLSNTQVRTSYVNAIERHEQLYRQAIQWARLRMFAPWHLPNGDPNPPEEYRQFYLEDIGYIPLVGQIGMDDFSRRLSNCLCVSGCCGLIGVVIAIAFGAS